jgi:DNA-binding beta-propeller fold protein YncE
MVADRKTNTVTVFNADTDTLRGSVAIGGSAPWASDCAINQDRTLGFVTDYDGGVWVIDLTTSPPSLAAGTNPILVSNWCGDLSFSPDGQFLLMCDGAAKQPISVVDIATRTEISTFNLGTECNSLDVGPDGSVLVTSVWTGDLRRLTIDGWGILMDTGEWVDSGSGGYWDCPNNVICAPDGMSCIVIQRDPHEIRSYFVPGLTLLDSRTLPGDDIIGISGVFSPLGNLFYVRSNDWDGGGAVDVYGYDPATGQLSADPLLSIPIKSASTTFGLEQMAMNPNGTKLYVSQPDALDVFDALTGIKLTSITDPNIIDPSGVCVVGSTCIEVDIDIKPGSDPNVINLDSKGVVPVAILGSENFDASCIDAATASLGSSQVAVRGKSDKTLASLEDVNGDGFLDLVCHVETENLLPDDIQDGMMELTGNLLPECDGTPIQGSDYVIVAPLSD